MPKGATTQTSSRKPKLGQHFLDSDSAALRIVEALGDISGATVLEIGPGRGAITELLARKARRLIAVELDRVLSAQLRMKFNLATERGDHRRRHSEDRIGHGLWFETRDAAHRIDNSRRNRPASSATFRITLPPIFCCACWSTIAIFRRIVIMVQKEVADRLSASPGSRDYGLLSATAQLYGRVENLFTLASGRLCSRAEGAFQRDSDYDQAAIGSVAGFGSGVHRIS